MADFLVEIITPDKTLYKGKAISITAKAVDGEVGILANHAPYVNILTPGEVYITTDEKTCLHFKHGGGILEVARDKTSILCYN